MSSLESNKSLAGVGALLLALGSFIPIVGIVGIILLLIGIKGLSEHYNDGSIYQNALWGVIFGIIGLVAAAVVVIALVWGSIFSGLVFTPVAGVGLGVLAIAGIVLAVVLLFVFYLLAAIYFRRAFSALAQKSGEHMFETAGLLLFIGAVLTIIVVGLVLVFVAWILAAVAFFSMRTSPQPGVMTAPVTPPVAGLRYCPNCGSPVDVNATFCSHCGRQLS